jgi:uncharacterized protein involved in exopolysaccharide biosynthesis
MTAGVTGFGNAANARGAIKAGNADGPREETSLLAFFSILLANRRLIAGFALLGTVVAGIIASAEADQFVSRAAFMVRGARPTVQLPGGAGALGVSLVAYAEFSQSVSFYGELLRSKGVLGAVASKEYVTSKNPNQKQTLAKALGIRESNPEIAKQLAVQQLSTDVSYSISSRTGLVGVAVKEADPLIAQQVNANILVEIDKWSRNEGHTQAVSERQFIEQLVADARSRLAQSEQAVRSFLELNRSYESSPELKLEFARLQRDVNLRQEVYTSLTQTYEQARIEEVRSPNVINIVETADFPVDPQRKEALRTTLIGLATGLLIGMVLAFLRQRVEEKISTA